MELGDTHHASPKVALGIALVPPGAPAHVSKTLSTGPIRGATPSFSPPPRCRVFLGIIDFSQLMLKAEITISARCLGTL